MRRLLAVLLTAALALAPAAEARKRHHHPHRSHPAHCSGGIAPGGDPRTGGIAPPPSC